jgi:hypothetical protein
MMDSALGSGSLVWDLPNTLVRCPAASLDDEAELPSESTLRVRWRQPATFGRSTTLTSPACF